MSKACAFFQEYLKRPEGAHAREYLAGRGLNEEIIKAFRIGFAPDSGFVLRDRMKGEFEEEVLRESGLFSWKVANSPQPSAVSPQPNTRSLDSARDDREGVGTQSDLASNDGKPTDGSPGSQVGSQTTSSQIPVPGSRPESAGRPEEPRSGFLLQVSQPGAVPHHQRGRACDCVYRAHALHRRKGWP